MIDLARHSSTKGAERPKWLVNQLKEMPVAKIVDFERHYRNACRFAYDERLWAAAFAISHHFASDDLFADFRAWLVAQGKKVYDQALANPDSLADLEQIKDGDDIDSEGFSMASVASEAYKEKTEQKDFSQALGLLPPPELKNANTWDGNPETLKQIVPRLHAKYATKL